MWGMQEFKIFNRTPEDKAVELEAESAREPSSTWSEAPMRFWSRLSPTPIPAAGVLHLPAAPHRHMHTIVGSPHLRVGGLPLMLVPTLQ